MIPDITEQWMTASSNLVFSSTITRNIVESSHQQGLFNVLILFGTQFGTQHNFHITGQSSNSPDRASLMMYVITTNIASGLVPSSCTGISSHLPVCKSSMWAFGWVRYRFILNSPSILQTSNEPSHGLSEASTTSNAPLSMPYRSCVAPARMKYVAAGLLMMRWSSDMRCST